MPSRGYQTQHLPGAAPDTPPPMPPTQVLTPSPARQPGPLSPSPAPVASGPPPLLGDGWYYADAGQRIGPLMENHLHLVVARGKIQPQTLVWISGMTDWQEARLTPLAMLFEVDAAPPPLAAPPLPSAPPAPRPVGGPVNDTAVWALAFMPLYISLLSCSIGIVMGLNERQGAQLSFFLMLFVNFGLALYDTRRLEAAGYNLDHIPGKHYPIAPIYLFERAGVVGLGNGYAWMSLLLSGVWFISLYHFWK